MANKLKVTTAEGRITAIQLTREQAIFFLQENCLKPGYEVMCKEYGMDNREEGDEDFVGLMSEDLETIEEFPEEYKTFELWANG